VANRLRPVSWRISELLVAEDEPLNLAARCLGQVRDEVDLSRERVLAQSTSDVFGQFRCQRRVPGAARVENHEGLDDLAPLLVRLAGHGTLGDRVVFEETALDVSGADPVARREDDAVAAPDEAD
jgi:hypothetical protein